MNGWWWPWPDWWAHHLLCDDPKILVRLPMTIPECLAVHPEDCPYVIPPMRARYVTRALARRDG